MGNLLAAIETDRTKRRGKAARDALVPAILVRNKCIMALADLPDPREALAVVEAIRRSIIEFIAAEATHISAGKLVR